MGISPVAQGRQEMVRIAEKNIGSRAWNASSLVNYSSEDGYDVTLDPTEWDLRAWMIGFKCNMFVADVAEAAGTKTWVEILNDPTVNRPTRTRDLTAKEWADTTRAIRGWEIVATPQPGDVASDGAHMGIVARDPAKLISASSREGKINEVVWHTGAAVLRRFRGVTLEELEAELQQARDTERARQATRCF